MNELIVRDLAVLVEQIAKGLVRYPDEVDVTFDSNPVSATIKINANVSDYGSLIGKDGKTIRAMQCLARATTSRAGGAVRLFLAPAPMGVKEDPLPWAPDPNYNVTGLLELLRGICGFIFSYPVSIKGRKSGWTDEVRVSFNVEEPDGSFVILQEWTGTRSKEPHTLNLPDAVEHICHSIAKAQSGIVSITFYRAKLAEHHDCEAV